MTGVARARPSVRSRKILAWSSPSKTAVCFIPRTASATSGSAIAGEEARAAREAGRAVEEDLGLVVAVEDGGVLHPPHRFGDERLGDRARGVAVVAEVDG